MQCQIVVTEGGEVSKRPRSCDGNTKWLAGHADGFVPAREAEADSKNA